MPFYRAFGDELVDINEIKEREKGRKREIKKEVYKGWKGVELHEPQLLKSHISPESKKLQEFVDIGMGKPMLVMIRHVYPGKHGGFGADMLATSAMKSITTFNAMPRAVNFVVNNIKKRKHLSNPCAAEEGTPVVFYTPALAEDNTILLFELMLDRIPGEIFDNLSKAFKSLSGIPIFASQSAGLFAGGIATDILKKILKLIFNTKPVLKASENLFFNLGAAETPDAGFYLVAEEKVEKEIGKAYEFNAKGNLVLKKNHEVEYEGDEPYMVISIDGREYGDEYRKFIPTAASAVLLEKFYNIGEGSAPSDILLEVASLYNDLKFKEKSDNACEALQGLNEGSDKYKKKKAEYDAYVANILNEDIKKTVKEIKV
ncbi:hypothetical protein ES703_113969 [subsurface metagenome]